MASSPNILSHVVALDSYDTMVNSNSDPEYNCDSDWDSQDESNEKKKEKTHKIVKANNTSSETATAIVVKRQREIDDHLKDENQIISKKPKESKAIENDQHHHDKPFPSVNKGKIWTEDLKITILEGLIEFSKKSSNNMTRYSSLFLQLLHVHITKRQLVDKVHRLKNKFQNYVGNDELIFPSPHDHKLFKLSQKLWGESTINAPNEVCNTSNAVGDDQQQEAKLESLDEAFHNFSKSFQKYVMESGLDANLIEGSKRAELVKEWKKVKAAECKYKIMEAQFDAKVYELSIDA